jgi:plastocyanin
VPGLSQELVQPGADFTYEFTATNPGTRWYHSHVDSNAQLELGLYGAFIVEPREPEAAVYDREFTYLLDEKALDFTPEVAMGQSRLDAADAGNGRGGLLQYDLFLINGKAGEAIPPLHIAPDERIRLRVINAGNLVHAMHLHGHSFSVVATDGNPVPEGQRWLKDTILIGPGERYDLEVHGSNPGVWMFHCHMPNHQDNGMMTTLVYAGHSVEHGPPVAPPSPSATARPASASPTAHSLSVSMVDNRFDAATLTIPVGATVVWSNTGLNLHTATAFDGTFETGTISPGASAHVTFDRVGTFRYYCRQHLLGGMIGVIQVVSDTRPADPAQPSL